MVLIDTSTPVGQREVPIYNPISRNVSPHSDFTRDIDFHMGYSLAFHLPVEVESPGNFGAGMVMYPPHRVHSNSAQYQQRDLNPQWTYPIQIYPPVYAGTALQESLCYHNSTSFKLLLGAGSVVIVFAIGSINLNAVSRI